ncbi:hypothetical protein DY000_02042247 [Brassica cretica]|uniref:Peptidase M16 C-terminal domain-containing protein n=1 Tax=Brassica cretica TaxID=69181 RepID=A0ABQ7B5G0_BRACR|nr:hypothetical protein DY000_02042247 [Brassica cretica]
MHGGDSAAATDDDHTIFFLFAESKLLEHVLDMFARLFIAPLMKPDSMNREIKSIDSEFEILKQSDTHRLYQLRRHTSKNDYPFNRFTAGNKKSLHSKNMNALLTRTKTFFADHYHGGSMKLCVIGRDSLTDLERWVRKYFDGVKDGPKSLTALQLVWMLPPYSKNNHLEMPEVYLIELLSNKSKESLYGFFKEKDWPADIDVSLEGHLGDYRSGGRLFSFSLYLTNSGLKKKYEMINYVYQYIKLLRDMIPQEWVWNQYWKMKEIEFDCLDVSGMAANSPSDFARYLSENLFVPTAVNLRRVIRVTTAVPICIVDKPGIKMWHQSLEDGPAYAYFCISLTDGEYSIKKQLIYHIFTELVKDELSYIIFEGKQASISNLFSVSEDKLVLKFRCCREKFTLFISKFWQNFKSFSPKLESFESFKEEMSIDLSSIDIKEQSEHMMFTMLYEGSYDVKEKLENLKDISFADLQKIRYSFVFPGLCYGDMLEKEATEISEIFERRFEEPRTPKVRNESASDRVKLNHPVSRKNAYVFKKSETNSMAKVYFQTSNPKYKLNEEEDGARLSLFSAIIKEELYDQLRTKKQLGYDVSCYKDVTSGVYGFYIYIVSSQYDPDHLLNEIDEFVNGIGSLLENVPEEAFKSYKKSVESGLFDDINSKWKEIVCKRYKFDCHEDYELRFWYDKYFKESSPSCRKFSVGIWRGQHQEEGEESSKAHEKKKSKHKAF